MNYTHKGWFFLCPVYLNANDGDGMAVDARHWSLDWWFDVNEFIFGLVVTFISAINHDYEPMFPFKVTGEINEEAP